MTLAMRHLVAVVLMLSGLLATYPSVRAQQPKKIARIGFLGAASASALAERLNGLRLGLRELGYIEGQNIAIDYRYADGKSERISKLAAELVSLNPDVIVTYQTPSVQALKNASETIPIVFTMLSFPVENGIVTSFARPGGNATGLTALSEELNGKRLELLKETVPTLARVAVLSNPENPTQPLEWKTIRAAAQSLGLKLQPIEVRTAKDFDGGFQGVLKERAQALIVLAEAVFSENLNRIAQFARKNKLPSMFEGNESLTAGILMSYGPNHRENFRRAAAYVDKILKGAKPGELPIEQPTKFELFINLKTANQIGLTIPPNVLARADRVIR